jgi:hypothetical protein
MLLAGSCGKEHSQPLRISPLAHQHPCCLAAALARRLSAHAHGTRFQGIVLYGRADMCYETRSPGYVCGCVSLSCHIFMCRLFMIRAGAGRGLTDIATIHARSRRRGCDFAVASSSRAGATEQAHKSERHVSLYSHHLHTHTCTHTHMHTHTHTRTHMHTHTHTTVPSVVASAELGSPAPRAELQEPRHNMLRSEACAEGGCIFS